MSVTMFLQATLSALTSSHCLALDGNTFGSGSTIPVALATTCLIRC